MSANTDALYAAVDAVEAELSATGAALDLARAALVEADEIIATQAARIAELEAIIDPPDPVPTGRQAPLLIGATIDVRSQTWTQAADAFADQLGVDTVDITRRFVSSIPTDFATIGSVSADAGHRHRWVSIKGDAAAATIAASLRTLPADGLLTIVAIHHEPDNDIKQGMPTHTAAWFQGRLAALDTAVATVRAEGRTDIVKSFVLTGWLDRDAGPGDSSPWYPANPDGWVYGIDPYIPNAASSSTLAGEYAKVLAPWRAHGGRMWAVAETGSKLTGQALAAEIAAAIAYCDADPDCVAWCYFHSAIGADGPWWLDDPAGSAAMGAAITANRVRWAGHPLIAPLTR